MYWSASSDERALKGLQTLTATGNCAHSHPSARQCLTRRPPNARTCTCH